MEVRQVFGMSFYAGSVAELNFGMLFSNLEHAVFVTEAVGKYCFASELNELFCGVFAIAAFFVYTGLDDPLTFLKALSFACSFECVDEVLVVSRRFVVKTNKTYDRCFARASRDGGNHTEDYCDRQYKCQNLFHFFLRCLLYV